MRGWLQEAEDEAGPPVKAKKQGKKQSTATLTSTDEDVEGEEAGAPEASPADEENVELAADEDPADTPLAGKKKKKKAKTLGAVAPRGGPGAEEDEESADAPAEEPLEKGADEEAEGKLAPGQVSVTSSKKGAAAAEEEEEEKPDTWSRIKKSLHWGGGKPAKVPSKAKAGEDDELDPDKVAGLEVEEDEGVPQGKAKSFGSAARKATAMAGVAPLGAEGEEGDGEGVDEGGAEENVAGSSRAGAAVDEDDVASSGLGKKAAKKKGGYASFEEDYADEESDEDLPPKKKAKEKKKVVVEEDAAEEEVHEPLVLLTCSFSCLPACVVAAFLLQLLERAHNKFAKLLQPFNLVL